MLKRLDPTLRGLRFGVARSMTGDKVAPIFQLGPIGIGRKVIGNLETGMPIALKDTSSMFENSCSGINVEIDPGGLRVYRWYSDPLGFDAQTLRLVTPDTVNQDPELKHYVHNPERC